jgi:hypothetical protein
LNKTKAKLKVWFTLTGKELLFQNFGSGLTIVKTSSDHLIPGCPTKIKQVGGYSQKPPSSSSAGLSWPHNQFFTTHHPQPPRIVCISG